MEEQRKGNYHHRAGSYCCDRDDEMRGPVLYVKGMYMNDDGNSMGNAL